VRNVSKAQSGDVIEVSFVLANGSDLAVDRIQDVEVYAVLGESLATWSPGQQCSYWLPAAGDTSPILTARINRASGSTTSTLSCDADGDLDGDSDFLAMSSGAMHVAVTGLLNDGTQFEVTGKSN
jgi:hypothetical protein